MNPSEEAPEVGKSASTDVSPDDESVSRLETDDQTRTESDDGLTKNEIFTILKNSRRRAVLKYLEANQGQAELGEVAEHVAAKESDTESFSTKQRKRAYISLYQVHLPKMDDMGVVEFNKQRGTIDLQDASYPLFPYLHFDPYSQDQPDDETTSGRFQSARSRLSDFVSFRSE